jgi:hypothetical protein
MPTTSKIAKTTANALAAALIVLVGPSLSAGAASAKQAALSQQVYQQAAAQQLKLPPRPGGPAKPLAGPRKMTTGSGTRANESYGCHDHASQTSYEGPCDNHPEYEATGGCESEATGTSYPGNCQNSSEP